MLASVAQAAAWTGSNATEIATLTADDRFGSVVNDAHRTIGRAIPRFLGDVKSVAEVLTGLPDIRSLASGGTSPAIDDHSRYLGQRIAFGDITAVEYRATLDGTWADLSADSVGAADLTDFEVDSREPTILRRLSLPWPAGRNLLRVTYSAGFVDGAAESTLDDHAIEAKRLVLAVIELLWSRRLRGGGDILSADGMRFDSRSPREIFRSEIADLKEVTA